MTDLFGNCIEKKNDKVKYCPHCGKEIPKIFFYKDSKSKDGHRKYCKEYEKEQHREIHARPHKITTEKKACACCGKEKEPDKFAKDKTQKDGLHSWCKECQALGRKHNKTYAMITKPKSRKRLIK